MTAPTIGSLCSGYAGLDLAVEEVTGGVTVFHCENDAAPSLLLAHHFPGVPNYHDLKALRWAEHKVDVLTGGYPCQPFSQGGKRLGTEDPRHLFPWIAMGIERMRPRLFLGENVAGHLTLGFDVVLAELDRLGYDVRWTVLPASAVGAPHQRMRLWFAAHARERGGWPRPGGEPTAYVDGAGGWESAQGGLFGGVPAGRPGAAGSMVAGERFDREVALPAPGILLLTPEAKLSDSGPDYARADWEGSGGDDLTTTVHRQIVSQLPTPTARDHRTGYREGGAPLNDVVQALDEPVLLPTPTAGDAKASGSRNLEGSAAHAGVSLTDALVHGGNSTEPRRLLPTPEAAQALGGHLSRGGGRSDELLLGGIVKAHDDGSLLPTPRATDGEKGGPNQRGSSGDLMLPSAVCQLPTPTARLGDASGRGTSHPGRRKELCAKRGGELDEVAVHLLPGHGEPSPWGPYTAAVARWEALTRPAPPPTEKGSRGGPRLSPAFVEWMQGLPAGWVTQVPGVGRNPQLKLLGNGVVRQCAAVAYTVLGVPELLARREEAA